VSVRLDLEDIVVRNPQKHYFGTLAPYINNSLFALVILMNRVYGPPHFSFMTHYISHLDWEAARSCATSETF